MGLYFPFMEKQKSIIFSYSCFFDNHRCRTDLWKLGGGTDRKPVGDLRYSAVKNYNKASTINGYMKLHRWEKPGKRDLSDS